MNKLVRIALFAVIFVILSFLGSVIISFIFYDRPIGFLLNFILFVMVLVASIHVSENIYNTFKEMNTIREMMTVMTTIVFVMVGLNVLVPFFEEPPTPIVTAGNIKIPVVKGSYCLGGKKVCG